MGPFRLVAAAALGKAKGFEADLELRDGNPLLELRNRGFGPLKSGIDLAARTSTIALFLHLLEHLSPEGRFVLVRTAHNVARYAANGQLSAASQARWAGAAVAEAAATLAPSLALGADGS